MITLHGKVEHLYSALLYLPGSYNFMEVVMRNLFIAVICGLTLSACSNPVTLSTDQKAEAMETIVYAKDQRTGLCFALLGNMNENGFIKSSITNVPCTPAVLAQIK